MPNRYVRESAIESMNVDKLSWQGEVFWRRLINRVDDYGRFTANHELLRASLFPLRLNKVSGAEIGKLLLECEHAGLLSTWKGDDGKTYLVMHRWDKARAKKSKFPEPPENICIRLHELENKCLQTQTYVPDHDLDNDNDYDLGKTKKSRNGIRFTPPSLEEVTAYCSERNNGVDPSRWMNHYESKGWIIGKAQMKDWRAAVRTWERPTETVSQVFHGFSEPIE